MKKVLIIDDDDIFRQILNSLMAKRYSVIEACDGLAARDMIVAEKPDAILTDLRMPRLDGVGLLSWVQTYNANLPVVLMTEYPEEGELKRIRDLGAFDILIKPFGRVELLEIMSRALAFSQKCPTPDLIGPVAKLRD